MSIDSYWHVPTGDRTGEKWREFQPGETPDSQHRVFLAHGANYLIDEQFFFDKAEDARWFFDEGYRGRLYEGEEAPDRMHLVIDGEVVDSIVASQSTEDVK